MGRYQASSPLTVRKRRTSVQEMEVEVSSNTAPLRRGGWESLGGGVWCARR